MKPLGHRAEGKQFRLHQRENLLHILGFCSFQVQQSCKIGVNSLRRSNIFIMGHSIPASSNGSGKEGRCAALALEHGDDTAFQRPLSFPVAPSGGLEDGIQSGLLPVDGGEVHIHAGLDQGSGHHPAGKPLVQAAADLFQLGPAVSGIHEGGEMETPIALQPQKDLLS